MRRFIYGVLVIVAMFGFTAGLAYALSPIGLPEGCSSTAGFSPITGERCDRGTGLPYGCLPGYAYSPFTGERCEVANNDESVRVTVTSATLSLQYAESQKGAMLAKFTGTVVPRVDDVVVFKDRFFGVSVRNSGGEDALWNNSALTLNPEPKLVSCGSGLPAECYRLEKAESYSFTLYQSFNPRQSFDGVYTALIDDIWYYTNNAGQVAAVTVLPKVVSNPLVIVGEISPYITAVNQLNTSDFVIEGSRLAGGQIDIDNISAGGIVNDRTNAAGTRRTFSLGKVLATGRHQLQIKGGTTGNSNIVYFDVFGGSTGSMIKVNTPNGGETVTQGKNLKLFWSNSDKPAMRVVLSLRTSKTGNVAYVISSSAANSGSYDWLVPNTLPVGKYYLDVSTDSSIGSDVSDGPFTVLAPANHPITITSDFSTGVAKGRTYNISWKGNDNHSSIDLFLLRNGVAVGALARINNAAESGSWAWAVNDASAYDGSLEGGSNYQIILHRTLQAAEDTSGAFEIRAGHDNQPPTISIISGPTSLNVSQTGDWKIAANDPEGGTLTYWLDAGDSAQSPICAGGLPCGVVAVTKATSVEISSTYDHAGVFYPVFKVTDEAGLEARVKATVTVGSVAPAYTAPTFDWGAGAASHRVFAKFANGKGKLTNVYLIPGLNNCYDLGLSMTNKCTASEYAQGATCGVYLQRVPTASGRCVVQFNYIDSNGATQAKFFESTGAIHVETIEPISNPRDIGLIPKMMQSASVWSAVGSAITEWLVR